MPSLLIALAVALLAGCGPVGYYAQAVSGHLAVMRTARPIPELVADPGTDTALKKRLEAAAAIREFAVRELGLPDNGSYRSYADIGRPYAVWNVFAAPEFSVEPRQWCMPFVGCVNYRGYYEKAQAERLAAQLGEEGLDTHVAGVPAYSTLGFFDDPVLNTFLRAGDAEVARILFHELAHQVVYVRDDTVFNESFAVAVENEGMRRWLARHASDAQRRAHALRQERKAQFLQLLTSHREKLRGLYALQRPALEQRRAKREAMAELKKEYDALRASWGGYTGFDRWFEHEPNNALLASVALYTQLVPAFEALLAREGGDLARFYRRVAELGKLPKRERMAALAGPRKPGDPTESLVLPY